ncbi:hypothetical protein SAMN05216525_12987 [Bradyrhizobium sp. Gha]|nr:hypothetical protein SAMN05216525_12987 [Bradyrhizobium sp. Gha]
MVICEPALAGIDLLPVLVSLGDWGSRHRSAAPELGAIAKERAAGGPKAIARMRRELASQHPADE